MSHISHTFLDVQLSGPVVRALLCTQGYLACGQVFHDEFCSRLSEEIRLAADRGPCITALGGNIRAIALLEHSDAALSLLDEKSLGMLVDEALGCDLILSRAEGVLARPTSRLVWQNDFRQPRKHLPSRAFRPGVTVLATLDAQGGGLEVMRASHHLNPSESLDAAKLPIISLTLKQGECVLLEGGVSYRLLATGTVWFCLAFVRPWIKPEVLFFSALSRERFSRLGQRGRRWCGAYLGLPTSVEEFLHIETEALESDLGRSKGSGI